MEEIEFIDKIDSIKGIIFKLCLCAKIPQMEFEDLKQEVLLKLWIERDKYDPTKSKFTTWSYKVISNHINDLYRMSNRDKRKTMNFYVPFELLKEQKYEEC